ncbi:hypothetical protein WOLCODRAFT_141397 [Wolfiporia cocos MD-104 SS10]|uniref:Uncharacterized protein n=1 Tax=Wolfiporia cocos (strain MD-104) TaxID=742152 RepID=A0A2H3JLW3_WOLCO|nr:hypothetical protein WOLCODRAFT_141397 [Wolfiporia cocos MD-104 SS10]
MSLLTDEDRLSLITYATTTITASDGRQQTHTPFKVVAPERRIATPSTRAGSSHMVVPGQPMSALHSSSSALSLATNGTPFSMLSPFKKMPSSSVPHLRNSSLGNMRPLGLPSIPHIQSAAMNVSLSSPHNMPPLHTGIRIHGTDAGPQSAALNTGLLWRSE